MTKIRVLLCVFLSFFILVGNTYSQVTIGSSQHPQEGALLDLKQEGTTTLGLLLPRVSLPNYDKLIIGTEDYAGEEKEHTGLMVYNVNPNFDKCDTRSLPSGLYVWSGEKWESINAEAQYHKPTPPQTLNDALYQPNSFMRTPGSGIIRIPVKKAFRVWQFWTSMEGYNRLGTANPIGAADKLSVSVVWMDNGDVVAYDPTLSATTGEDAVINVTVGMGLGNAVVALHIGPTGTNTDPIRWSWHIWVTDVDMNDPAQHKNYNGLVWMDRNLGANNAIVNDPESKGVQYQWGRKDPFPNSRDWTNTEPILKLGEIKTLPVENERTKNLDNSISQPQTVFYATSGNRDWYSTTENNATDRWDSRWGTDRVEDECHNAFPIPSITDPCPEGWQVPNYSEDGKSPWAKEGAVGTSPSNYTDADNNNGYDFEREDYKIGWYPATGGRGYGGSSLGNISSVGVHSLAWSSSSTSNRANNFRANRGFVYTSHTADRSNALPVRCVKKQ